jgi:hypothetical protein
MPPIEVKLDGVVEDEFVGRHATTAHVLRVRVRGPNGAPVSEASVECDSSQGLTGPDGIFKCSFRAREDAWPIQVKARKEGASGMTRTDGTEAELEVVIREGRTIRGRVEGPTPPRPCKVVSYSATEMMEEEVTGSTFTLHGRGPVRLFVCLDCPGELESDLGTRLGCAVAEAAQEEVVIVTGAPGTLALKVLDSTGKAVDRALFYIDREGRDVDAIDGEMRTEVVPGNHVLVINLNGKRERAELPFSIRPGETTSLGTVRLK